MNKLDDANPSQESILFPLIGELQDGTVETHDQLLERLRDYFHRIVSNDLSPRILQRVGHSDIVQQSCVRVIEGIHQFRGTTEAELRAWLRKIISNELRQVGREMHAQKRDVRREVSMTAESHQRMAPMEPMDAMLTPRSNALAEERKRALLSALEQLPQKYQQVIKLRSWQGKTFPQIAKEMGKSIDATEKLWYRALIRLRAELKSLNEVSQ